MADSNLQNNTKRTISPGAEEILGLYALYERHGAEELLAAMAFATHPR